MVTEEQPRKLVAKWTADIDGCRSEERRLELNDRARHATSIAMLEARAQAIDQCILELTRLNKLQ